MAQINTLSLGDVNLTCGPSPCGFLDLLWSGDDCNIWQQCAAAYNAQSPAQPGQPPSPVPCVVGGLDEYGNTIVSCGDTGQPGQTNLPCLRGAGPLQPGQEFCYVPPGDTGGGAGTPAAAHAPVPAWVLPAIGGLALLMLLKKR